MEHIITKAREDQWYFPIVGETIICTESTSRYSSRKSLRVIVNLQSKRVIDLLIANGKLSEEDGLYGEFIIPRSDINEAPFQIEELLFQLLNEIK